MQTFEQHTRQFSDFLSIWQANLSHKHRGYILYDTSDKLDNKFTSNTQLIDYGLIKGYIGKHTITPHRSIEARRDEHLKFINKKTPPKHSKDRWLAWQDRDTMNAIWRDIGGFETSDENNNWEGRVRPYPYIGDNIDIGGYEGIKGQPLTAYGGSKALKHYRKMPDMTAYEWYEWFANMSEMTRAFNCLVYGAKLNQLDCVMGLASHYENTKSKEIWENRSEVLDNILHRDLTDQEMQEQITIYGTLPAPEFGNLYPQIAYTL